MHLLPLLRPFGFCAFAIGAVVAFILAAPADPDPPQPLTVQSRADLVDQALSDYDANFQAAADDATLQAVVNGWVARDLLFITTSQLEAQSAQMTVLSEQVEAAAKAGEADDRVAWLALIGVLALCFHGLTSPLVGRFDVGDSEADTDAGDEAGEPDGEGSEEE